MAQDPSGAYTLAMSGMYPDPTQWSNPYSQYNNAPLPFPPSYAGVPTNAMGQPIPGYQAPPQGTTLNSAPQAAPQQQQQQQQPIRMATTPEGMPAGQTSLGRGVVGSVWQPQQQPQPQQQQAAPQAQASGQGSYQAALDALSNPGNPVTPGSPYTPMAGNANAQQSQGLLNNFIQNWKQGGMGQTAQPGIGGGSSGINVGANNPFFAALQGQR
jgi:hypothetical protein